MVNHKEYINTKENNEHYKGRIWVTKGYKTRMGNNICADTAHGLMVIAFVPQITDEVVMDAITAMGWRLEDWLF